MFRGPSWDDPCLRPALLPHPFRRTAAKAASREWKTISSGASSRLTRFRSRRASAIACRRRSDLWSPAAPSFRCRLSGEAGTAVPITHALCTSPPSRESEKCWYEPVDNGDIGAQCAAPFARLCELPSASLPPIAVPESPAPAARAPLPRRPEPAAARGGADHRRAGAGAGRRRHRQDRGADRAPRQPHRHPPRLAEPDPRRHLHQQGRARDEGARVGQISGGAIEGMPWLGTFHSVAARMLRTHAELVGLQVQLHHPRHRRPAARAQAADPGRQPRREALARAPARRDDRPLEEPRLDSRRRSMPARPRAFGPRPRRASSTPPTRSGCRR